MSDDLTVNSKSSKTAEGDTAAEETGIPTKEISKILTFLLDSFAFEYMAKNIETDNERIIEYRIRRQFNPDVHDEIMKALDDPEHDFSSVPNCDVDLKSLVRNIRISKKNKNHATRQFMTKGMPKITERMLDAVFRVMVAGRSVATASQLKAIGGLIHVWMQRPRPSYGRRRIKEPVKEMTAWMEKNASKSGELIFQMFDANQDGTIEKREFVDVVSNLLKIFVDAFNTSVQEVETFMTPKLLLCFVKESTTFNDAKMKFDELQYIQNTSWRRRRAIPKSTPNPNPKTDVPNKVTREYGETLSSLARNMFHAPLMRGILGALRGSLSSDAQANMKSTFTESNMCAPDVASALWQVLLLIVESGLSKIPIPLQFKSILTDFVDALKTTEKETPGVVCKNVGRAVYDLLSRTGAVDKTALKSARAELQDAKDANDFARCAEVYAKIQAIEKDAALARVRRSLSVSTFFGFLKMIVNARDEKGVFEIMKLILDIDGDGMVEQEEIAHTLGSFIRVAFGLVMDAFNLLTRIPVALLEKGLDTEMLKRANENSADHVALIAAVLKFPLTKGTFEAAAETFVAKYKARMEGMYGGGSARRGRGVRYAKSE